MVWRVQEPDQEQRLERFYRLAFGRELLPHERKFLALTDALEEMSEERTAAPASNEKVEAA